MKRKLATIICGNAGVGKTTFGARLARDQGALLLDIDTVSEDLVVAGLLASSQDSQDRDSPKYKSVYREAIHTTLYKIANDNLDTVPCIIVAPFTRERREPDFLKNLRSTLRTHVRVFYLVCDDKLRRKRIEERRNPRDQAKLANWDHYSGEGRDSSLPPFEHELVNTTPDCDDQAIGLS